MLTLRSLRMSAAASALALGGAALPVMADTYAFPTLNIQNNTPSMSRPIPNGTNPPTATYANAVPYDTQEFYATLGGTVTINLDNAGGGALAIMGFVYGDVFNPASPLTNCIIGVGDGGGGSRVITFTASAHRRYILVTTPFDSTRGTVSGDITSSGLVVPIRSNEATWTGGGLFAQTFNRPVANGTSAPNSLSNIGINSPYTVRRIWVSAAGRYTFFGDYTNADNTFEDGYIFVYNGSFNAGSPLANCLIGNDDIGGVATAFTGLSVNLPAAGNYYVVSTTYETGTLIGTPPLQFYSMPGHSVHVTGPGRIEVGPFCTADFNRTNGVSVQDVFDFLTAWFAGCN